MKHEQIEILKRAILQYGVNNQLDMVTEECSELIQALCKLKRGNFSIHVGKIPTKKTTKQNLIYANLCSEVADVKIMIAQLEVILNKEMIDLSVERKIDRLKTRLEKQKQPF